MIASFRRLARFFGYDLTPLKKARDLDRQIVVALISNKIDCVIDVGANSGQYARKLRRAGWNGPILSIEPLPELNEKLLDQADADPDWYIAPPLALGDRNGQIGLHRSAESDMSSVLHQNPTLERLSPSSAVIETIEVPQKRFDAIELPVSEPARLFLKLDVQGYEATVLEGVGSRWPFIQGLQLEMALLPIYEGECFWRDMVAQLADRGFDIHLLLPGYFAPKLARQLQCDGVFFRSLSADR